MFDAEFETETEIARRVSNARYVTVSLVDGAWPDCFRETEAWVGGRAVLTTRRLVFRPNALNRAALPAARPLSVPLEDVVDVAVEPAFGSDIIHVAHRGPRPGAACAALSFRCWWTARFAAEIRSAARGARAEDAVVF